MIKKVIFGLLTVITVMAFSIPASAATSVGTLANEPGGGGSYPYDGATKVERIYVSKGDLMAVGGAPTAAGLVSGKKIREAAIRKLGRSHPIIMGASGLSFMTGMYAELSGYDGYVIKLTYTYQVDQRVFDGTKWVDYTGWGTPNYSVYRY